ncbi:MAG: hypothetical protein JSW63_12385 [Ignavibacterium sp.]|nr:MAG: hypothetical protein JSW63_12385 [Ignavibacterium sp.]
MKIFAFLVLISSTIIYPQQSNSESILKLEHTVINTTNLQAEYKENLLLDEQLEKKSAGLAILYSLLLPGMGELYADAYDSGKYFTIAEGVLVATYIGMSVYANNQEDNYKAYATSNANVNTNGKDETYFATISEFDNIFQYNDEKALERNFNQMYETQSYFWKWASTEDRQTYRSMWSSSEQTFNDLRFVVGLMLLNRVVSAINAARLVSAYNSRIDEQMSWNISLGLKNNINLPTSVNLNFQTTF